MQKAGIQKSATQHPLRHCSATDLLEKRHDIRTVHEFLSHKDVSMIHTHVRRPANPS